MSPTTDSSGTFEPEWLRVDNDEAVLVEMRNQFGPKGEPLFRIGFRCWIPCIEAGSDAEWVAELDRIKMEGREITIMWPMEVNVSSAKLTLKALTASGANPAFESKVVKLWSHGAYSLMRARLADIIKNGKTTPSKKDRRIAAKKRRSSDDEAEEDRKMKIEKAQSHQELVRRGETGKHAALLDQFDASGDNLEGVSKSTVYILVEFVGSSVSCEKVDIRMGSSEWLSARQNKFLPTIVGENNPILVKWPKTCAAPHLPKCTIDASHQEFDLIFVKVIAAGEWTDLQQKLATMCMKAELEFNKATGRRLAGMVSKDQDKEEKGGQNRTLAVSLGKRKMRFPRQTRCELERNIIMVAESRECTTVSRFVTRTLPLLFSKDELATSCLFESKQRPEGCFGKPQRPHLDTERLHALINVCWRKFGEDRSWYDDFKDAAKFELFLHRPC